jgi:hypothetical protein
MRTLILVSIAAVSVTVIEAEQVSLSPAPIQYAGYYVSSFEKSLFKPVDSTERWWLSGSYSCPNTGIDLMPRDQGATVPVFLIVRGKLSAKGRYGHMGAYDRELVVEMTISCRPLRANEKAEF